MEAVENFLDYNCSKDTSVAISEGRLESLEDDVNRWWQVYSLLHNCIYKRCFFLTSSGRFGLGPSDTQASSYERVCVTTGAHVPLVLRRGLRHVTMKLRPLDTDYGYQFVGQAFVDGIMYGEGRIGERKEFVISH